MKIISYLKKTDKIKVLSLSLSFLIPAVVILLNYAINDIAPLGSLSLCSMDGFSQYYPMLMNMADAVREGELFYSFKGALGFNLWAQSAYYTNSILWLPLYFIPHSLQVSFIDLTILFKLSLGGLFFCYRLLKRNKNADYKIIVSVYPALSTVWALSGYMCAFINQLMWTDVVVLLPLVILGIEKLTQERKPALYIFSLFLSIISCFYLSFMVCIFSVLWFFFLMFREKLTRQSRFKNAVLFGISSLIAGGMSGVVILPVYKALSLTKASTLTFDGEIEIIHSLKDFLFRFIPFQHTSLEYGAPNLYCTLTVVILFIVFLFSKNFSRRYRVSAFIFVTFMLFSMSINLGDFIWHGLHYPNQLPARQSFLAIFLLLSISADFLTKASFKAKYLKTLITVIYIGVCLNFCVQFTVDVWASKISSLQRFEYVMEDFTALDDEDTFSRMEWTDVKKNNYPQQYGYNGISYYSSTMTEDAYDFFQNMGMGRYAKNVSVHYKQSDILNAVFSIKYIMSGEFANSIKENKNILSLGFISSEDVLSFNAESYDDGIKAQQGLWDSLCGEKNISFEKGFDILSENQLDIISFDTDLITGKITSSVDGVFFTSVPYDEGWEIFIDGEKQEIKKSAGYFLSCEIEKGEHDVILKYTVPGIKAGALISVISLLSFTALVFYCKRKNYRRLR